MKQLLRIVVALLVAATAMIGCAGLASPPSSQAKEPAYDFAIILHQGETRLGSPSFNLAQLQGRPVALNFWAGLCPPCRAEMPEFQEFHHRYDGEVALVGVDLGQYLGLGSREDAKNLLSELGVTYPAGFTDDDQVVEKYRVLGLPTTVFINSEGKVYRKWDGLLTLDKLSEIADQMLAEDGQ